MFQIFLTFNGECHEIFEKTSIETCVIVDGGVGLASSAVGSGCFVVAVYGDVIMVEALCWTYPVGAWDRHAGCKGPIGNGCFEQPGGGLWYGNTYKSKKFNEKEYDTCKSTGVPTDTCNQLTTGGIFWNYVKVVCMETEYYGNAGCTYPRAIAFEPEGDYFV